MPLKPPTREILNRERRSQLRFLLVLAVAALLFTVARTGWRPW
ncbi:hypothetical protein SAMN05421770_101287 [Granulicella rosea]|uniref:Uncharacterized protein n=1 Tax=Granulicella rosea TaxID=474952 RepID=A0A239D5Y3_9BACT|nr:hypothetical protein [Granulicella rosea]SNS27261.1 hypothetical protein SAMN05421770_101287 [Granulicella rosea]